MKSNITNPWLNCLPAFASDAELTNGMRSDANALADLSVIAPNKAAITLNSHLASVYVPTRQHLNFARRVLDEGYAHALSMYESRSAFERNTLMQHPSARCAHDTVVCTGPDGSGKSECVQAIRRLLAVRTTVPATTSLPELPIVGGIFLSNKDQTTGIDLLNQIGLQVGFQTEVCNFSTRAKEHLRKVLYRSGAMFILLDDMRQWASSRAADAAYVRKLMLLRELDVPLVITCSHKMAHSLLNQSAETGQQLLNNVCVFEPLTEEGVDFRNVLTAYKKACGAILAIDIGRDSSGIFQLTQGNLRELRNLLVMAYAMQRKMGNDQVALTLANLRQAHNAAAATRQ